MWTRRTHRAFARVSVVCGMGFLMISMLISITPARSLVPAKDKKDSLQPSSSQAQKKALDKPINKSLRIHMVTFSDRLSACLAGSDPMAETCIGVKPVYDINKAYADVHNYSFTVHAERKLPLLPYPWEKIVLIRDILVQYDAVLWIDHDAYVQDHTRSLSSWLERYPTRHLIVGDHTRDPWEINTGVFLIRNSSWSLELMESVLTRSDCDVFRANPLCCWEQDCLQHIAKNGLFRDWDQNVLSVPGNHFNCRSEWRGMELCKETGFAYHFMGQPKAYHEIDHAAKQALHGHTFDTRV